MNLEDKLAEWEELGFIDAEAHAKTSSYLHTAATFSNAASKGRYP